MTLETKIKTLRCVTSCSSTLIVKIWLKFVLVQQYPTGLVCHLLTFRCSLNLQAQCAELHVVNALGQQDVPEYVQQPAKAITEDVSVMHGPEAEVWIQAILEE